TALGSGAEALLVVGAPPPPHAASRTSARYSASGRPTQTRPRSARPGRPRTGPRARADPGCIVDAPPRRSGFGLVAAVRFVRLLPVERQRLEDGYVGDREEDRGLARRAAAVLVPGPGRQRQVVALAPVEALAVD